MLFFRSGMFVVGPESAGANPGPACYGKGDSVPHYVICDKSDWLRGLGYSHTPVGFCVLELW